ncbi:haloacid dehalogenase, partial [Micromonospora sp. C28SCA-DRY-2]|nr:haloacid dehalogenase [Micromonospora sp. C28SCA-DRY-2]
DPATYRSSGATSAFLSVDVAAAGSAAATGTPAHAVTTTAAGAGGGAGRSGRGRTVLVVRSDSAGDVLVTGAGIRAVAAGADRVVLLCGPRGRAAADLL